MNSTPPPDAAALATALRARADGFHQAEAAAVELLVCNASWLHREDFRDGYVHVGTSGIMAMAAIDWPTAIAALDNGDLPCSGGERGILRLAASLPDGIPVDPRDALTGMDAANVNRAVQAMLHAAGASGTHRASGRPGNSARSE